MMFCRGSRGIGLAGAALAAAMPSAALGQAAPAAILFAALEAGTAPCTTSQAVPAVISKSEALLGGAPSALALILRQQEGAPMPAAPQAARPMETPATPACAMHQENAATLPALSSPRVSAAATLAGPDDFLGSRRIAVSRTVFDAQWQRVSQGRVSQGTLARLGLGKPDERFTARLATINAWVNGHVRYTDDRALYGRADYWANSRETLRRRAGDCEDLAILKFQLLVAAGVPRDAMFLTIARDLVRHADHALLVVRDGMRFWLLDNSTDALVDAGSSQDYRPIFSYGQGQAWLHGYGTLAAAAPPPKPALSAL